MAAAVKAIATGIALWLGRDPATPPASRITAANLSGRFSRCDQLRPDPSALTIHAASAAPKQKPLSANRVMVMLRDSSRANAKPRITVFPDILAVNTWLFKKIAASIEPAEPVKRMRNQSRVARGTSFVVDIGGAFLMSSFMKSEWPINQSDGLNRTFCPFLPCCPMKAFLAGSNNRLTDEKAYLRKIENSDTSTVSALREELPRCYARRRGARRSNPVSWTVGQQIPCTRSRSRRNTASPFLPGLMISRK